MQYRSLSTVIRKLCSSEDSERRLGERLCKLKKECKPINQGTVISATVRQVTLLCLTRGTWGAWINQKKKQLEEYFFQVSQLTIVTKERGGYWAHLISHSSCQQQALHLHYLKGKISTQKYL